MLRIDLIDSLDGLHEFAPEWSQFLRLTPPPTPFQTPEWMLTWWSNFGSGKLHVLVFREDRRPAGVLPCFLIEWNNRRQLTLIGSGISDYLDPVFDPQHRSAILDALWLHLESQADWEICDWQDLSADSPLRALGPMVPDTPCSAVELAHSVGDFFSSRPHGLKRNLRRYREKAQAIGPLTFQVVHDADPALISAFIDLHRARWRRSGQPGVIDANCAARFIQEVATKMAAAGALRIFTLRFQDRIVATVLALCNPTTVFSYLSAFDPEYETFGFGRELLARAFDYAHAHRYRCWNFLRGDERYKFDWGARWIPKCRLKIERSAGDRAEIHAPDTIMASHV